tara:strand:+ start:2505 stop:2828 length:324 start_codon:yes stop_codon:yes gene_type:complete
MNNIKGIYMKEMNTKEFNAWAKETWLEGQRIDRLKDEVWERMEEEQKTYGKVSKYLDAYWDELRDDDADFCTVTDWEPSFWNTVKWHLEEWSKEVDTYIENWVWDDE